MGRKLASIQYVHDITPIEGADKIELAHVLGWQCVVKKGEFKVGDLGVYFEIDSFLPVNKHFAFLGTNSYKKTDIMGEGYRIRTMKMRGELSQGLLIPLSEFDESEIPNNMRVVNTDVSNLLGIKKWEVEERATDCGTIIGQLPDGIPKTDETRVQAMPELIKELGKSGDYYITTKMDGSSHSIEVDSEGRFHCTGHNYEYKDDGTSGFYNYVNEHCFESKLKKIKETIGAKCVVFQGEFCAPGIQSNRLRLRKPEWFVFTVIIDGVRQNLGITALYASLIGAKMVPVEEIGDEFDKKYPTVEDVLKRADESMYTVGEQNCKAEGIVVRPVVPVYNEEIHDWLSMKAVSNKYLLKLKG